jgi:hypothetical protein
MSGFPAARPSRLSVTTPVNRADVAWPLFWRPASSAKVPLASTRIGTLTLAPNEGSVLAWMALRLPPVSLVIE